MPQVPLVRVVRSGVEESVHTGSVAVADAAGRLVAYAGTTSTVAFARSTMKPIQAAVSLSLIGDDERGRGLTDDEVAVAAGSHNGEPVHLDVVRMLLGRGGFGEDALLCPHSSPLDPDAALAATERRSLYHKCSGKHAAMLLACAARGLDPTAYTDPDHPLQRAVLEAVHVAAGDPLAVGIDGCGVPVHAFPLVSMATLYARLVRPDRLGALADHADRAATAMRRAPYLVEGRGPTATALMQARDGLVAKGGVEGLVCAAFAPDGLGVAVKIADGSERAAIPAMVHALLRLGVLDERAVRTLGDVARPSILGGGRGVGEIVADFELTTA